VADQEVVLNARLKDGTLYPMYRPHPKQLAFHESDVSNLLAIGSRGSGKSLVLRMDAHMRALSCPGANLILVRKTYKDLLKSHVFFQGLPWGSLKKEMELLGGTFHSTDYICHYPNGSKLFLSYVGHESDAMNLLSAEFIAAYFDELSVIPWEFFIKLQASVRASGHLKDQGIKGVVRAATNPLGESTATLMDYFVTQTVDPEDDPEYDKREWSSIRMDMEDNPHLDLDDYKKRFAGMPEHVRKAWLFGEYTEEGALFSFYPAKEGKPYHVINDLDVDSLVSKARIFRVYDHGYRPDPAYCAWIAHLGNRYIVFHEKLWFETIASDIAADILKEDLELGVTNVISTLCDPSIDIHTGTEMRTIKGVFEHCGVPMDNSINNRELFAAQVHTALAEEVEPGIPRIQFFSGRSGRAHGVPYMIKALPLQRYNPKKPMAMADHQHDHPVVALAYFLISHSANERNPIRQVKLKPWMRPKGSNIWVLGKNNVRKED